MMRGRKILIEPIGGRDGKRSVVELVRRIEELQRQYGDKYDVHFDGDTFCIAAIRYR